MNERYGVWRERDHYVLHQQGIQCGVRTRRDDAVRELKRVMDATEAEAIVAAADDSYHTITFWTGWHHVGIRLADPNDSRQIDQARQAVVNEFSEVFVGGKRNPKRLSNVQKEKAIGRIQEQIA